MTCWIVNLLILLVNKLSYKKRVRVKTIGKNRAEFFSEFISTDTAFVFYLFAMLIYMEL